MDLSIIILNYKSRGLLKQCLKGILERSFSFSHEIIVVDNCSHDGTDEMMKNDFPQVPFIQTGKNIGFSGGNNIAIRKSTGKYVLIMNPDIAVMNDAIERMYAYMESHPNVGIAAPRLLNPDGTVQTSCREFPSIMTIFLRRSPFGKLPGAQRKLRKFLMLDWDHNDNRPVDWVLGACMMVRRSAMDDVGLMDERFFLYFEDVDWCRRFWEKGYPVYYLGKDAELVHYHQRISAVNPGLSGIFNYATRVHIKSGIQYFNKYAGIQLPKYSLAYEK